MQFIKHSTNMVHSGARQNIHEIIRQSNLEMKTNFFFATCNVGPWWQSSPEKYFFLNENLYFSFSNSADDVAKSWDFQSRFVLYRFQDSTKWRLTGANVRRPIPMVCRALSTCYTSRAISVSAPFQLHPPLSEGLPRILTQRISDPGSRPIIRNNQ